MPWYRSIWHYLRTYFTVVGFAVTMMALLSFALIVLAIVYSPINKVSSARVDMVLDSEFLVEVTLEGELMLNQPKISNYLEEFFSRTNVISLAEMRQVFRKASIDKRVQGMRLILNSISGGTSEVLALRNIIKDFAKTKAVEIVLRNIDDTSYFLASAAKTITLTPTAGIMLPGPSFDLVYFGEALRNLGVDLEVVKAGKYKSAFEPFVSDEPSAATLEEYQSLEAHLRSYAVREVAQGRGVAEDKVRSWYAKSIFTAKEALAAGIVDRVEHLDKLDRIADPLYKQRSLQAVTYKTYRTLAESLADTMGEASGNDGIALIEALGEITMNDNGEDNLYPGKITKQVNWAMKNDQVKAVVLRVDSPGGSALASEMMWYDLHKLAITKPIIVSMGNVAASGGYYISSPSKMILAEPTTITGSIGVISMIPNIKRFGEKYGVRFYSVSQSERKGLLNLGSESTEEDRRLLEETTDEVYTLFKQRVSSGRGLPIDTVEALAQGRVYTGEEALALGLVDKLGGLNDAFTEAKKLAGLDENKKYPVLQYQPEAFDIRDCLRRPNRIMKCLMEVNSHVKVQNLGRSLRGSIKGTINAHLWQSKVGRLHARVENWLTTIDREGALALWPQYYSIQR